LLGPTISSHDQNSLGSFAVLVAASALSLTALKDEARRQHQPLLRAGHGDVDAPLVVAVVDRGQREMVSTISSAGCLAASMARPHLVDARGGARRVSLCTTHTALMVCALSCARRASMALASAPLRQSDFDELRLQAELDGHVAPQRGEVAGLVHQHLVAGRQRIDEGRLPRAGAGGRIDEHRVGGL
jgi:hypothetical protein